MHGGDLTSCLWKQRSIPKVSKGKLKSEDVQVLRIGHQEEASWTEVETFAKTQGRE